MRHPYVKPLLSVVGIVILGVAFFAGNALSTSPDDASPGADGLFKAVLRVDGMSCSGCIETITKSLAGFDGINDIRVDVAGGSTEILYDGEKQSDPQKMAAAITASGYPAKILRILSPEQLRQQAIENQAKSTEAIAAVGGLDVPRADYETELAHARSRYQMAYGDEALQSEQGQRLMDNLKTQIAQRLIDESIQLQEIRRTGFRVPPSLVAQQYDAFWKERGFADGAAFEKELQANGYSAPYFKKRFENRVLINTYLDQMVMTANLNAVEKQRRYTDWFANARLLAGVTYYDKELERLIQQQTAASGCGQSCSVSQ